jgi:hypothetical protein
MEVSQVLTQESIERHPHQTVDVRGFDNHEITSIHIVTAGAVARSQRGDVILVVHQYAYHLQQGMLIHSSCQLESFANDGNDKSIHIPGGLQLFRLWTVMVSLSVFEMDCRILA